VNVPLALWCAFWRWRQLYHRYTVDGLEHLDGGRAMLIVGYHGRPFAYDVCMLTVALYDRYGYLPHGVIHRGVDAVPGVRAIVDALGFVTGDDGGVGAAVARGEHVVVTPGGAAEGCRGVTDRYRVAWGERSGYVRLALRHGLPIVPVAAAGADDTYVGLYDGPALGRRLGLPSDWAWLAWLGLGPLGPWPLSPPFPVRLRQLVGAPIDLATIGVTDLRDHDGVARAHRHVTERVQNLLDEARDA
jgi:1-acyl-sn-glycerol-3-phosphate acyltransferase